MDTNDFEFHSKVLRLLKGIVRAYDEWLKAKQKQQS